MGQGGYGRRAAALVEVLLDSLGEAGASGDQLAGRANHSRAEAIRAFRRATGETPGAFRRRLTLERAAWQLARTPCSVTGVALDAGFESLEAFTRAFRRAYGLSPSLYRRAEVPADLPAASGIHHRPHGVVHKGAHMDLQDHLLRFDEHFLATALRAARALDPRQLDAPLGESQPLAFEGPDRTLRELLDKMIFTKEVWVAAARGGTAPLDAAERDRSLDGLEARMRAASPAFLDIAREVQAAGKWREEFTDALCEPPEMFPYGGMLAHVISVDAHRRAVLAAWLGRLGVKLDTDPMLFGARVKV